MCFYINSVANFFLCNCHFVQSLLLYGRKYPINLSIFVSFCNFANSKLYKETNIKTINKIHNTMKKFDPATNIQKLDGRDPFRGVNPSISDSATFAFEKAHLMTDTFHGETEGYSGYDHVEALLRHAPGTIDVCIANSQSISEDVLEPYRLEGVEPIRLERKKIEKLGIGVAEYPLATGSRYIRHDSDLLAQAVMEVYRQLSRR